MRYTTTITSKGTITIAAPIRKMLGFKPGQRVNLTLDKNRRVTIDGGTDIAEFETLRHSITKKLPAHSKALSGQTLKEAAAKAWVADSRD
jgi:AbrB family looped-hinge helix DNA binding protein